MSQPVMNIADVALPNAKPARNSHELSLLEQYMRMRETSMRICAPLGVEDHALQPMPDASPAVIAIRVNVFFIRIKSLLNQ